MDQNRKIIYADELLNAIREDMTIRGAAFAAIMRHINTATAVEVAPVVHGRWIKHLGDFECSVCGAEEEFVSKRCPNCGAIMDLPRITENATAALDRIGANAHGGE